MALPETVEKIKLFRRISHNRLDQDIADAVDACLLDLSVTAGIKTPDETDPLILAACKLYYAIEDTDDPNTAREFRERYTELKASLQMAAGYGGAENA